MDEKSTENDPHVTKRELKSKDNHIRSVKGKSDARRTLFEKLTDSLVGLLGTIAFLLMLIVLMLGWIGINVGLVTGVKPFDPYPFGLLAMFVSFIGVLLALLVLISQKRESKIAHLRAEIDLQVDMLTEREITKLMQMMRLLIEKNGIDISNDKALQEMLKPTDVNAMEKILERQVTEQ